MRRFAPEQPLPPYTYIPGRAPHPHTDVDGHCFAGCNWPPDAARMWPARRDAGPVFWYAVDLFHLGFYWESHEMWERCWIETGRRGALADGLKCLIKFAAAGVKAREGRLEGIVRHAARAYELGQSLLDDHAFPNDELAGARISLWIAHAAWLGEHAETCLAAAKALGANPFQVAPIFPFLLVDDN